MTERECKNRECPLFDEDASCSVLAEAGVALEDVEACSLAKVSFDEDEEEV